MGAVAFKIAGLKSSFAHGLSLFRKDDSKGRDLLWPVFKQLRAGSMSGSAAVFAGVRELFSSPGHQNPTP